jgi:hypothetical protein
MAHHTTNQFHLAIAQRTTNHFDMGFSHHYGFSMPIAHSHGHSGHFSFPLHMWAHVQYHLHSRTHSDLHATLHQQTTHTHTVKPQLTFKMNSTQKMHTVHRQTTTQREHTVNRETPQYTHHTATRQTPQYSHHASLSERQTTQRQPIYKQRVVDDTKTRTQFGMKSVCGNCHGCKSQPSSQVAVRPAPGAGPAPRPSSPAPQLHLQQPSRTNPAPTMALHHPTSGFHMQINPVRVYQPGPFDLLLKQRPYQPTPMELALQRLNFIPSGVAPNVMVTPSRTSTEIAQAPELPPLPLSPFLPSKGSGAMISRKEEPAATDPVPGVLIVPSSASLMQPPSLPDLPDSAPGAPPLPPLPAGGTQGRFAHSLRGNS